jgi:hypothetical protein
MVIKSKLAALLKKFRRQIFSYQIFILSKARWLFKFGRVRAWWRRTRRWQRMADKIVGCVALKKVGQQPRDCEIRKG